MRTWWLDREAAVVLLVSVLFTLPLWLGVHPPMTDYPQHLSMASILRWYHDPARHLVENYTFAYTRPNTAFFFLVAGLSYVIPLEIAGKLLMAISVAATGMAGLSLARRAGRPGWFGLLALLSAYNFAFFFGFVNNLIATPLFAYGIVLADRLLDRPMGWRAWLALAAYGSAFYFVHLQFLFLFVGVVGWLALLRSRHWRDMLPVGSALLPGLLLGAYHFLTRDLEAFRYHEKQIYAVVPEGDLIFDRLVAFPRSSFGEPVEGAHWLVFLAATLAVLWLVHCRRGAANEPSRQGDLWTRARSHLWRSRFPTIGAWFLAGYLLLPGTFVGSYVYQRLAALLWLLLPAVLPQPDASRLTLSKALLATSLVAQLFLVFHHAHAVAEEARDGLELIQQAEPGKSLMSLVSRDSGEAPDQPPPLQHFAAYYLAAKGGRINSSFSDLYVSPVQLRPGLDFDDLNATVPEWAPLFFRFADFGYHFDYFLFHGDFARLQSLFGSALSKIAWKIRGNWALLWRKPTALGSL